MTSRRVFHGWRVVGAGAVIQSLQSGFLIQAFGHYVVKLHAEFGWSKTMLAAGYSVNRAESGLLGPLQGWALDRFGAKRVMRVGVVTMAVGFFLFAMIQERWQYFAALLVMAVGASLSGFLSIVTATVKWFERKRARALSYSSIGFAFGGVMIPLLVYFMGTVGWRTVSVASGVIVLVVAFPLTVVFGGDPASRGEYVDGIDPSSAEASEPRAEGVSDRHFTAAEAVRTRAFWMISLGHASALLVVGAILAHLPLFLTAEEGFSDQGASYVSGALPLLQLVGMLAGGYLGDRVNKRLLASVAMLGHMVGLLVLTYATSRWMIWLFVPLHGLAWGVRGPLMQALRADYFGSTSFGKIMGLSSLIVMLGMVAGPLIAGWMADRTGTYQAGFTTLAAMSGMGVVFFILATPPAPPPEDSAPHRKTLRPHE